MTRREEAGLATFEVEGFQVAHDEALGHLMVEHDGSITWDQLQAIKCAVWGNEARAIEVYPRQTDVVNVLNIRHLWRLGPGDFCPDLLGAASVPDDNLQTRFAQAWADAL